MLKRTTIAAAVLMLLLLVPASPAAACHKGTPHGSETVCYPFTTSGGNATVSGRTASAVTESSGVSVPVGAIVLVAAAGLGVLLLRRRRDRSLS